MKDLIKKLKEEGKTADQICAEIAKDSEKELNEVVLEIRKELKALDAQELFKGIEAKEEAQKAEKSKLSAEVKEAVKEVLKDMPAVKEEPKKDVKAFNHFTKKIEISNGLTEGEKALASMLGYLQAQDVVNAKAVNKEILSQKEADYLQMFGSKTALYSNSGTGAYTIPTEVEAEIFQLIYQSVMLQIANSKTISYNGKVYPVMTEMELDFIATENTQIGDKTPTLANPTLTMQRIGGMAYASNRLAELTGGELVRAFIAGFGDAGARFADKYIVASSITGSTGLFDGILFNDSTEAITAKALTAIDKADFKNLKNALGPKWRAGATFIANTEVRDAYGDLEDTAGNPLFRSFLENGTLRPYGKNFLENAYIPDDLDIATEDISGGTDNVLLCVNGQGLYVGFDPLTVDMSEHLKFDYDQVAYRGLMNMAVGLASSSSEQGACASYIKLTD
jgi:HK97 family phage major capsid protein